MRRIITLVILATAALVAQNKDMNITGAGARAEGFAGAYIGLADDATAVVWNPSGLTQLERLEASVVTRFRNDRVRFENNVDPALNAEESQGNFSLNFGSVALPMTLGGMKMVIAAAFQRQLDFNESQTRVDEYPASGFLNPAYRQTERYRSEGGVNTITPAVGIQLLPILSVGLAANIWTGSMDQSNKLEDSRFLITSFDEDTYTLDFSGLNFVVGAMLDLGGMKNGIPLKIGMTAKTPFELTGSGSFSVRRRITGTLDASGSAEATAEMPLMLGFGTSYRFGENLTVSMDYEMRMYGDKKLNTTVSAGAFTNSSSDDISESREDLNEFRIGAEYLVVKESAVIPLRAGFKTVPSVDADYYYDGTVGDFLPTTTQSSGTGFALGTGFITNAFAFDVTYSHSAYDQKYDTYGVVKNVRGTLSSSIIIYF